MFLILKNLMDLLRNALQVHRQPVKPVGLVAFDAVESHRLISSQVKEKTPKKKHLVDRAESCNYLMTNTVNKQTHDNEKENRNLKGAAALSA